MIHIQGLHKFFYKGRQNEIHVINDVSLDLPEKGMVAIFGKSGCGKTTLLNVIGGLDKYAEGTLTVDGKSIREDPDGIRNRYIGYIFQNYNLNKSESCFENVADAMRLCGVDDAQTLDTRVMAALSNVGMEKYAKRTPDTLSGGQQQRIAIARAIVKNPRIILADEPTGNLDEANTVMIMDLLKAISKDHLVLLVTHEADLVDYYCDTVIELQDGKIVGTRENASANGFSARNKHDIYLGELPCHRLGDEHAEVEYYGDRAEAPVKLQIVNQNGKLYVRIGTEKVQVIDAFSEVKLHSGIYEEKQQKMHAERPIDMSMLPPVEGKRFGHLFSFRSSVKSGYSANFAKQKKGKRLLRGCMALFAAVIVFMTAVFGSFFGDLIDADSAYNHNVFYVYTPNAEVSAKLNAALGNAETGIDALYLSGNGSYGDRKVSFRMGTFETFPGTAYDYESNFKTNAVYLDMGLTEGMKLVAGRRDQLEPEEILISTQVADALLEKSVLGYVTEREDLIGFFCTAFSVNGKSARIAGIVESEEPAVYLTEIALAKYSCKSLDSSYFSLGSDYDMNVAKGETVLAISNMREGITYPSVGETILIHGVPLKVTAVKKRSEDYSEWLLQNGISKMSERKFFEDLAQSENAALQVESDSYFEAVDEASKLRYYEYYDYYYAEIGDFYRDLYLFSPDLDLWLYLEQNIEDAKYTYLPEDYYKAYVYRKQNGAYPTVDQLQRQYDSLPYLRDTMNDYERRYEDQFYSNYPSSVRVNTYFVADDDYIALSKQLGETHPSASAASASSGITYEKEGVIEAASVDVSVSVTTYLPLYYTVVHSNQPKKTEAFLRSEFSDLSAPNDYMKPLITPDMILEELLEDSVSEILTGAITLAVLFVLMSICMYFMMRSSLMNRIKAVGIYRAIGVSKKNLIFKFLIESVVLTTLTVFVGYCFTSLFITACLQMSPLVAEFFYYPMWLAGAVLVVLYAMGLFFGTLPILSLLRKTPSEILAKYDI